MAPTLLPASSADEITESGRPLAKARGALTVVDNTFLSPVLQRPFEFGADVTVYSATKYFGGHNDLCAGALVARTAELGERLYFLQNSTGGILPPQDCWLLLRSLNKLSQIVREEMAAAGGQKQKCAGRGSARRLVPGARTADHFHHTDSL